MLETMETLHMHDNATEALHPSRLTLLPAEIRNQIYRLLLISPLLPRYRHSTTLVHCSSSPLPTSTLSPALLLVCRQINSEATPILYGENTFAAHPSLLTKMPYLVDPARRICSARVLSMIGRWHVHVRLDCDARWTAEQVQEWFDGVESLEIEAGEAMFRSAGVGVLMLFQGVRGVGRAVVRGSVGNGFARWLEGCMMGAVGTVCGAYEEEAGMIDSGVEGKNVRVRVGYDVWTNAGR